MNSGRRSTRWSTNDEDAEARKVIVRLRDHPIATAIIVFFIVRFACSFFVGPTTCADGWQSASIGRRGACSWHHGVGTNWGALLAMLLSAGCGITVFVKLSEEPEKPKPPRATGAGPTGESEKAPTNEVLESQPVCRQCGIPMTVRTEKEGLYKGILVWVCPKSPRRHSQWPAKSQQGR
jgi:hypothetical protein